jgi:hypothetical protein
MNAVYKTLTLTVLASALAACTTVGPDYHVPKEAVVKREAANATFMGAAEQPYKSEPLPADWWRLYQDPVLDKLVAKAFAANADLRVAAANLSRTHAVLEEVEEKKRPEVEMAAAPLYGRIAGASIGLPEQLPRTGIYDGDIKVAYQLDMFGRIRRAIEAAEADLDAAQAAADVAHVMVAADTTRAYAEACSAGYQLKVAQQSVDLQQKFVKLTGERVQRGRGIAIDNSRAQAQLDQLRANLPPLMARQRTALYRLAVLTGEVPSAFPAEVAKCTTPPNEAPRVMFGYSSAVATPMRAVAPASRRSAWRTSGRRRSRAAPSPTGMLLTTRGGVVHCATSAGKALGTSPVSTARRYRAVRWRATSGGRLARSWSSWAWARLLSMAMPRPRCTRSPVSLTNFCCRSTDCCATFSW